MIFYFIVQTGSELRRQGVCEVFDFLCQKFCTQSIHVGPTPSLTSFNPFKLPHPPL